VDFLSDVSSAPLSLLDFATGGATGSGSAASANALGSGVALAAVSSAIVGPPSLPLIPGVC
jgi:hypothetical protein